MFDNIGAKIKSVAKIIAWIGIIAGVIYGGVVMLDFGQINVITILAGLSIMVVIGVASWLSSLTMYGFGQLIEDTSEIKNNLKK